MANKENKLDPKNDINHIIEQVKKENSELKEALSKKDKVIQAIKKDNESHAITIKHLREIQDNYFERKSTVEDKKPAETPQIVAERLFENLKKGKK